MFNHQMALLYGNWVKRSHGVDLQHPDHSINCTAVAVLHLPALPLFPGHVSLIHAVHTIGARVDALQLCHADLFRRVHALPYMIQRTFVRVSLDILRQNVLSLRWQPMMLSQLRCGTKLDHLKLLNTIRHVQQATRHVLPLCLDMKIHYELLKYVYGQSQGLWYFRGRKITENHGNRPTLKITEIMENHGKSRKITETETKVPIVCYRCCTEITGNHGNGNESSHCLLVLLLVAKCWSDHGNTNQSSHCLLFLLLVAKCWSVYFFVCFQL